VLGGVLLLALVARIWDLSRVPDNIYPDQIQTGTVATQSYITTPLPRRHFSAPRGVGETYLPCGFGSYHALWKWEAEHLQC